MIAGHHRFCIIQLACKESAVLSQDKGFAFVELHMVFVFYHVNNFTFPRCVI